MAAANWDYSVFGLRLRSELPLPELFPVATKSAPQVRVRVGKIPDIPVQVAGLHPIAGGLLLVIDRVGRYFVKDGIDILIDPDPSAQPEDIRLFLLGSAMGALLHQRGLLPLHANAVEIGGKAFAFMGPSGAGKSTLAVWFHDRGYRIVADDVCVVRVDPAGIALASPGLPRLRLWKETLAASGREPSQFSRSFSGEPGMEKYDVPIARNSAAAEEIELAGVYLLQKGSKFAVRDLEGVDAAEALIANTYRGAFVGTLKGEQAHWAACVRLLQSTPVFLVQRRLVLDEFDEECGGLLRHALSVAGQRS